MPKLNQLETEMLTALEAAESALSKVESWCGNRGIPTGDRAKIYRYVGDSLETVRTAISNAKLTGQGLTDA